MKLGLLYEIDALHPSRERSSGRAGDLPAPPSLHDVLWQAVEQVQLAEELGFHSAWSIDHALVESTPAASAPEMWLAALAQHTQRIRLGHGLRWEPFAYDSPIRVAERSSVLDIMSEGRAEFGTGRPPSQTELERLGLAAEEHRAHWDEALRMLAGMWTEDAFSWASERFEMPPRNVLPKPLQQPHPPLWMSGSDADAARFAGERGLGFMDFGSGDGTDLERARASHREALAGAKPLAGGTHAGFAVVAPLVDDRDAAGSGESAGRALARVEAGERLGVDLVLLVVPTAAMKHDDILAALRRVRREQAACFEG